MATAAVCLGFSSAVAQKDATLTRGSFQVIDAGQPRLFELALDEVEVGRKQGKPTKRAKRAGSAEELRRSLRPDEELVLYEAGKPRDDYSRRVVTPLLTVKVRPQGDPTALAKAHNLVLKGAGPGGYQIFEATKPGGALKAAEELQAHALVEFAQPQLARQQSKRFAPNDTFFLQQWHLRNTGQSGGLAGTDVNISSVWDAHRGSTVRIGIVDDGLQLSHPDLAPNLDSSVPTNHHDWNDTTPNDPSPVLNSDLHGTACAGLAAARGHNSLGVTGAAPEATLVGLRLIGGPSTDSQEAEAMAWKNSAIQVKSNSWGPVDDGRTLEAPGPLTMAALKDAAENGRSGLGTILVWAGGNGASATDDGNYDGYANSIYTIAVGAIDHLGNRASYSEPGANLVVSTPGGDTLGIVTTDLVASNGYNKNAGSGDLADRDYTSHFTGTSASTPLAAGCIALMLQANTNLGWRDVQEILMTSAVKVSPADADWVTNGAGFHFNHDFGAGMINTAAAIALASSWSNLGPQQTIISTQTGLNVQIPDDNAAGITRTFTITDAPFRAEHVTVRVDITHPWRGDLEVTLISPNGTQSRLAQTHNDSGDNYAGWTFMTVRSWGESAAGTWTLKIADVGPQDLGMLTEATLTIYGTPINQPDQAPSITSAEIAPANVAFTDEVVAVANIVTTDPENDPVSLAYQWEVSETGTTFTPIADATSQTLSSLATHSGKLVRCVVTPSARGSVGSPFTTAAVAVDRRPVTLARHAEAYLYDSDVFLQPEGPGQPATFRFAASSDTVPGLSLDAATGVLSGAPNLAGGGFFEIVLERFTQNTVATRTFQLLVLDVTGSGVVPIGTTWTLLQNVAFPGSLTVLGTLDTSGYTLTVGSFEATAGAALQNGQGVIRYFHRTGLLPPGQSELIPDAVNDLLDLDHDGLDSLLEFTLGTDPGVASVEGLPSVQLNEMGQLELTYSHPEGAGGVTRNVQVSGDLGSWNLGVGSTETISDTTLAGIRTVVVRDLGSGPRRYIRFKTSR